MVSIRYKAFVPAGLLGTVLIAVTAMAHVVITELTSTNASLAGRYHEIEEVRRIEIAVNKLAYPLVAALVGGSSDARASAKEHLVEIRAMIDELREMAVVNSEERELLDIVENRLTHIEAITGIMLGLPASEHQLAMSMLNDLSAEQLAQLSQLIHTWHEDEARQVNALQAASETLSSEFRLWTGMFAAALTALLVFALWLNNRILVKPVMTISRSTSRLAAGELDSPISLRTNDELGGLATDINNMASSLQSVHRRLESMANTDTLTGLFNRRSFETTALREFEAARRYRRKLAIALLDIDHFKDVNDTHGHHVGDEVLRAVANLTATALRQSDYIFRYGGEEFVLLLQEADAPSVAATLERCRRKLADNVISVGDVSLRITASFGAACYPADGQDIESLLKLADQALYAAKNDGRNRCYTHESRATANAQASDRPQLEFS